MKISNKEKIMLFILGIIVIGFGYYRYIYLTQINKIEEKVKEEIEIKQKYEKAKTTIDNLEEKINDIDLLKGRIEEKSKPFYPIINEENIILELDKLLKDNELEGKIKFEPIISDSVEKSNKINQSLAESSLQSIVDKYNNDEGSSSTVNESKENNTINKVDKNDDSNFDESKKEKKDTLQYVKIQIDFEGSYSGLFKMLTEIGEKERKIVINSIKLTSNSTKGLNGSVNLEIYSIPKINDELKDYLKWDFNNSYGTTAPFAIESGNESLIVNTTTELKQEKVASIHDFIATVKSVTSDLPKVMLGKANDDMRTSYIYGNNNSQESVEMVLTQDGNKYYYKYKTSKQAYPVNYDGLGEEFIPKSNNIVLSIISENKLTDNDNSKMMLKIINKTDKNVEVNMEGDDSRVTVDANKSNVKVN